MKISKRERPKSVTVIGWIIILWNGLYLLNAMPLCFQAYFSETYGRSVLGISATIVFIAIFGAILVSGIAILKGNNWGRILYLLTAPIVIVFGCLSFLFFWVHMPVLLILLHVSIKIALPVIFYVVVLISLKKPAASAFFAHRDTEE